MRLTMFSQPQRLRRLAAYVLLVWLFGLGSGIVNACIVQSQLQHAAHAAVHEHHDAGALDGAHVQDMAGHQHEHGSDVNHPPCERLCDSPSAVAQTEKQQVNPLSGFWLASIPLASFIFQPASAPEPVALGAHVRWRDGIPIAIAFLRLAL